MSEKDKAGGSTKADKVIAEAIRARQQRERGYRELALKRFPWICARCGREFTHKTVHQLTIHHTDHNHDNNPPDGSNWELLCIYCHENEHARFLDHDASVKAGATEPESQRTTYRPFENLRDLLKDKGGDSSE